VPLQYPLNTISGWDIRGVYFAYNSIDDRLFAGLDCFGVCGDADGDGKTKKSYYYTFFFYSYIL
jgi:hypothetical protein